MSHKLKAPRQLNLVNSRNMKRETFFYKYPAENEAERLVPDHFLFFKKPFYKVKASVLELGFIIF